MKTGRLDNLGTVVVEEFNLYENGRKFTVRDLAALRFGPKTDRNYDPSEPPPRTFRPPLWEQRLSFCIRFEQPIDARKVRRLMDEWLKRCEIKIGTKIVRFIVTGCEWDAVSDTQPLLVICQGVVDGVGLEDDERVDVNFDPCGILCSPKHFYA